MAGIVEKFQKMWNPPDDEYEDYYDDNIEQDDWSTSSRDEPRRTISHTPSSNSRDNENKVLSINAKTQLQVVIFKPISFGEETRAVADELIKRHTVVLNLEKTDRSESRRIVDFLSGVAYANNGKIKRIATNTFIITPYNVDLMGEDVLDELEHSGVYL